MKKILLLLFCMLSVGFIFAQHTIRVDITTDCFGSQTTWNVTDVASGTIILSGGPYTDSNEPTVQDSAVANVDGSGCYLFTIYDSQGNGMDSHFGTGSYTVYYDNVLVGTGGDFTSSATLFLNQSDCATEIAIQTIDIPWYCVLTGTISVSGTIINNSPSLTSFDVTYKIDDGAYVDDYTVACNATLLEIVPFTHDIPASFSTNGNHTITVMVKNPNGIADNEDNNSMSASVYAFTEGAQRKVLMEHFTTAQCPNCPAAITNLTNCLNTRPNVIWISHHAGYYTDEYTIPLNSSMLIFYNSGSTYAPAIMLDRTYIDFTDVDATGPVFFPSSYTPSVIDEMLSRPAFVSVNIEGSISADNIVNVTISGEFAINVPNDNLRLSLYIIEEGLSGYQSGGGSNYPHNHVVRAAISAPFGDDGVITSSNQGNTYSKTYTFSINENEWVPENCRLVAFVNNYDPSDVNNCEILNSEIKSISELSSGIDENEWNNVVVYPNPATDYLNISCVQMNKIEIVNALGQVVYSNSIVNNDFTVDLTSYSKGFYFIRLSGDNGTVIKKFIKE